MHEPQRLTQLAAELRTLRERYDRVRYADHLTTEAPEDLITEALRDAIRAVKRMTIITQEYEKWIRNGPKIPGYTPTRFNEKVAKLGSVGASRWALRPGANEQFLDDHWQYANLSSEASAHYPWFQELFTDEERQRAAERLDRRQFNWARYRREWDDNQPDWWIRLEDGGADPNSEQ